MISERSEDGLSSHGFISFSKFLTKPDILGDGLNEYRAEWILWLPIVFFTALAKYLN
jgi:hypothetical protein